MEENERIFTELIHSVERSWTQLVEEITEKQRAAGNQTEKLTEELEVQIAGLEERSSRMKQFSESEDHIHFLQVTFRTVCIFNVEDHQNIPSLQVLITFQIK